jgi:hypothetical protein
VFPNAAALSKTGRSQEVFWRGFIYSEDAKSKDILLSSIHLPLDSFELYMDNYNIYKAVIEERGICPFYPESHTPNAYSSKVN